MFPCALPDAELQRLLAEAVPYGDVTMEVLGIACIPGTLRFAARGAMTVCGTEECVCLLALVAARAPLQVPRRAAKLLPVRSFIPIEAARAAFTAAGRSLRCWWRPRQALPWPPRRFAGPCAPPDSSFRWPARATTFRVPKRWRRKPFGLAGRRCTDLAFPRLCCCFPNTGSLSQSPRQRPSAGSRRLGRNSNWSSNSRTPKSRWLWRRQVPTCFKSRSLPLTRCDTALRLPGAMAGGLCSPLRGDQRDQCCRVRQGRRRPVSNVGTVFGRPGRCPSRAPGTAYAFAAGVLGVTGFLARVEIPTRPAGFRAGLSRALRGVARA
jgi:hypothetical protein